MRWSRLLLFVAILPTAFTAGWCAAELVPEFVPGRPELMRKIAVLTLLSLPVLVIALAALFSLMARWSHGS